MISTMSYTTILIVVAASILGSDGGTCSCKCCAGNSCTATLQGIIDVQSCDASPCEALCGSKYPQQCVNGPGIGLYECSSGSVSTSTPHWIGTYNIANNCDQRTCCCIVGKLVISSAGANSVRVQCSFAGDACPSAGLSLDETIPTPNGYTTQVAFMGNPIRVTLSEDSRSIQFTNSMFPSCSDTATKSGAISGSQINMGLLSLFVGLITIKQFKM